MADQFDKEHNALRDLYCNLMVEVRWRTDLVSGVLQGTFGLPRLAAYELCYLQFRLICELVALGALAAHGDIPAAKSGRLIKAYQADAILNGLEKLHPDFYPQPSRQIVGPDGKVKEVVPIKSGFMTKPELVALYHQCGDLLHRGTLRAIKPRTAGDFTKIQEIVTKIITLLNHHQINLIDPKYALFVLMKGKDDGKVHAALMAKIGSSSPR
jgi:hypothetical protein